MHISRALDANRWELWEGFVHSRPARHVFDQLSDASSMNEMRGWVSGLKVTERYGWLAHYTTKARWDDIRMSARLGLPGLHLTPTGYDPETGAIELGLPQICDRCLLIAMSPAARGFGVLVKRLPRSTRIGQAAGSNSIFLKDSLANA